MTQTQTTVRAHALLQASNGLWRRAARARHPQVRALLLHAARTLQAAYWTAGVGA